MYSVISARLASLFAIPAAFMLVAAHPVPPKNLRGKENAACRANETGPALRVTVNGLKDRAGQLRIELYPANENDFLAADKDLIAAGKVFKRVDVAVPASGTPTLCIRAPQPGTYAVAVLHDRDRNGKFGIWGDGIGAPGRERLGRQRPDVSRATVSIGGGIVSRAVTMQYLRGFGFAPVDNT